ncbi:hypothetical protein ACIBL6_18590 [Streptomyces sp. NPDC050400]|uniref:hypothetical protein n=1 Tax=Streptomyces sp. NPDC050400 TaxID=3365610 RepID=UPI0037B5C846
MDDDDVLLAKGDCYEKYGITADGSSGQAVEVPCDAASAVGRILKHVPEGMDEQAEDKCPGNTDEVFGYVIKPGLEKTAASRGTKGVTVKEGYSCARFLKGPHPHDPGQGGPGLRVGDCLADAPGYGGYEETECEDPGSDALGTWSEPEYIITKLTTVSGDCPRSTDKKFQKDTWVSRLGAGVDAICVRPV